MAYVRKTVDSFEVQGFYNGSWEMLTSEPTKRKACNILKDYRENAPNPYRIKKVREKLPTN